jgi:hypothetical protein
MLTEQERQDEERARALREGSEPASQERGQAQGAVSEGTEGQTARTLQGGNLPEASMSVLRSSRRTPSRGPEAQQALADADPQAGDPKTPPNRS